jgi:hypothetical protein
VNGTYSGTATLSATLKSAGNGVSGKSVSFTLNGNNAGSVNTDATGVATLSSVSLAGISAGSYPAGVGASFAGDGDFASSNATNALSITYTYSQAWRVQYFGSPDNTGDGADMNDFDHDGLANLLELGTHSDPTGGNGFPGAIVRNGATLEFTYSRSIGALDEGILFNVEWVDDLSLLNWSSSGVSEMIVSDDGTIQVVKASVPDGNVGHRYLHLKITRP